MPILQLIYIISHMRRGILHVPTRKIKRTLKFMKVIQVYILNIFYTKHIIYMIKKWQMKSKHNY